jgi:branched-chain amino acid transport system ATP-binding protein
MTWDVSHVFDEFERLAERSNQRAGELSGRERQMIVIVMALVGNPTLVLLDEPMEGLAP